MTPEDNKTAKMEPTFGMDGGRRLSAGEPALALSAGGSKGAYQIGCWKALNELGISFQAISGSSIGALNAALIAQGDLHAAEALWHDLAGAEVLKPDKESLRKVLGTIATDLALLLAPLPQVKAARLTKYGTLLLKIISTRGTFGALLREGVVNMASLEPLVSAHLDMARVLGSPVPVFITTYSFPTISRPLGRTGCYRLQDLDVDKAVKLIVASMSLPFIFPAVQIDGISHRDGGMGEWLPVRPLLDEGHRSIIALSTKPGAKPDTRDHPRADILTIGPAKALARFPMTLRFTPENVQEWMACGYEDAMRALARWLDHSRG